VLEKCADDKDRLSGEDSSGPALLLSSLNSALSTGTLTLPSHRLLLTNTSLGLLNSCSLHTLCNERPSSDKQHSGQPGYQWLSLPHLPISTKKIKTERERESKMSKIPEAAHLPEWWADLERSDRV
jgi:hypothetical protein